MSARDGERRSGRYIKASNHKLIDSLALYRFSFEEICENPIAHRDNPNANIIRHKLHEVSTIDEVVLEPEGMNKDLRDEDSRIPILQPVDFTSEWKRHRARNVNRPVRIDDDEESDLDLEFEEQDAILATQASKSKTNTTKSEGAAVTTANSAAEILQTIRDSAETPEEVNRKQFQAQKKTIDAIGKAIQNINTSSTPELMQGDNNHADLAPTAEADDFIPLNTDTRDTAQSHEAEAISQYKARAEQAAVDPQIAQAHYDSAKASGYEDGFKVGEEKATLQMQTSVAPLLSNITSIVQELELVKKTILDNVQQNFYEITQAIAETLIRREINISPQAFATVVRQAISDSVPDDKITIAVNPETYENLAKLEIPDLMSKVIKDEQVKPGDFRIDSALSVVDGNISKTIANLIAQADLQLFEKEEKAS